MSISKPKRKTDPCPCGSGDQYRYCHGAPDSVEEDLSPEISRKPRQLFLWVLLIGAPVAYIAGMYQGEPETRVWSEEHGHYHTVDQLEAEAKAAEAKAAAAAAPATDAATPEAAPAAPSKAPPGPTPPGKVWSAAHGHWHDIDGANGGEPLQFDPSDGKPWDHEYKLEKPVEERPNATWSEAHGHWHDNK